MSRPPAPCGTHSAYTRHVRLSEPVDEACRVAHNTYQRDYSATLPAAVRLRYALRKDARRHALIRLGEAHPDRLAELMAELATGGQRGWQVRPAARRRLATEHPAEFARLHAQERAERGLK
ncbi:hypothetical protein [Actinomadura formosensis]|uniref:hypothetical protein n=1 Tax=Actinomadura formosensis TaxID=60706 RepID=UPI003D9508BC